MKPPSSSGGGARRSSGGAISEEAFSRRWRRKGDPMILFLIGMIVTTSTVPFLYSHVHRTTTTTISESEKERLAGPAVVLLRQTTNPNFRIGPKESPPMRYAPSQRPPSVPKTTSKRTEKNDTVIVPSTDVQKASTTPQTSTSTTMTSSTGKADFIHKKNDNSGLRLPNDTTTNDNTPILIYNNMHFLRTEPCEIPCEYTSDPTRRKEADASVYERRGYAPPHADDKFPIYLQMEGEHYYPIRLNGYKLENTYRWENSPLLKPYFEWIHYRPGTERYLQNPPVPWNSTINGASFVARNCRSRNHRETVVKYLMDYGHGFRVDSLSSCLHNRDQPRPRPSKIALLQPYKFTLAFENGRVKDYVTEKVYEALASGVIPVYLGAPNIREYVPDGSIIHVDDFESSQALAEHLVACMNNETLYNSYHSWRFQPLPPWFVRKFNFTKVSTECRTCRYMHALRHGWEWDKENQRGVAPASKAEVNRR